RHPVAVDARRPRPRPARPTRVGPELPTARAQSHPSPAALRARLKEENMAITEIPARGCKFELNTGTNGPPNWAPTAGTDTTPHTPTTTRPAPRHFEDGGRLRHWVASRGDQFTLSGKRQEDPDTGDRDPGQEAVEAWAQEVGPGSIK